MRDLEPQQLIASSVLFRNLQPDEARAIIGRLRVITYPRGQRIIERGVLHGQLYILATGAVSVLLQEGAEALAEVTLERLGPGECFGEMSLITGEVPTATVRAEQDSTLWSLSQSDFLMLVGDCPTLSRNINHVLSERLARTNQLVLSARHAECIWLHFIDNPDVPLERSLALHIAQALAERSLKRVLLLELCNHEQSTTLRFASHPDQLRSGLLACIQSPELMGQHRAPVITTAGRHFPALATLTNAADQDQPQAWDASGQEAIQATLSELAAHYDYLLLVTTHTTPAPFAHVITQHVARQCQRAIVLVSASQQALSLAQQADFLTSSAFSGTCSLFVAHVPEVPTIGAQDRYATQLGIGLAGTPLTNARLERLLPADLPLLERCWQQRASLSQLMPGAQLTKAIDFVARFIARQTVGIAFGGGGARGFAHIGVLKRLLEHE